MKAKRQLAADIIDHYERHARDWDADRNNFAKYPWADKPWLDRFVAALPENSNVLDLGCGSGAPVAKYLAECGVRVTGIDSSPTLVSLCRKRLPEHDFRVGDMRSLNLPRKFDGILAWDSFFHLTPEDQRRMFGVFARHAAPGCVLMFNAGPAHGEAIGEYRGDPLYHASLDQAEYAALLAGIGFEIITHKVEDRDGGGRTAWLARRQAEPASTSTS